MVIITRDNGREGETPLFVFSVRFFFFSCPAALSGCQLLISAMMEAQSTIEAQQQYELQIHVYLSARPFPPPPLNECSLKISSTLNCFTTEATSCKNNTVTYRRKQNLKPQTE